MVGNDASPNWGDGYMNKRSQAGAISSFTEIAGMNGDAPLGDDDYGILVGTDDTAEDIDQYSLIAKVVHGRDPDQLYYYRVETNANYTNWSWDGGTRKFTRTIYRFFANWSGGTIGINEVGFARATNDLLLVRDNLSSTVNVAALRTLRAKYTITSTEYP